MRRAERRSLRAGNWAAVGVTVAVLAGAAAPVGVAQSPPAVETVTFRTVPPVQGARLRSDGRIFTTDARGRATLTVRRTGPRIRDIDAPKVLATRLPSGKEVRFDGFFDSGRTIGLALYARTRLSFLDRAGKAVPARKVAGVQLRSSLGVRVPVTGAVTPRLRANHVARTADGVRSRPVQYAVERVEVEGGNVVNRAQQRFYPLRTGTVPVRVLLYAVRFAAHDALLGGPAGTAVRLVYPNGRAVRIPLRDGRAAASGLPRGEYRVRVEASGYTFERPVWLSHDQVVDLQVVSPIDLAVVFGGLASVAIGLLILGHPTLRRRLVPAVTRAPRRAARAIGLR